MQGWQISKRQDVQVYPFSPFAMGLRQGPQMISESEWLTIKLLVIFSHFGQRTSFVSWESEDVWPPVGTRETVDSRDNFVAICCMQTEHTYKWQD